MTSALCPPSYFQQPLLFLYVFRWYSVNPIFDVHGFRILFNCPNKQNCLENLYINIINHLVLVKKCSVFEAVLPFSIK